MKLSGKYCVLYKTSFITYCEKIACKMYNIILRPIKWSVLALPAYIHYGGGGETGFTLHACWCKLIAHQTIDKTNFCKSVQFITKDPIIRWTFDPPQARSLFSWHVPPFLPPANGGLLAGVLAASRVECIICKTDCWIVFHDSSVVGLSKSTKSAVVGDVKLVGLKFTPIQYPNTFNLVLFGGDIYSGIARHYQPHHKFEYWEQSCPRVNSDHSLYKRHTWTGRVRLEKGPAPQAFSLVFFSNALLYYARLMEQLRAVPKSLVIQVISAYTPFYFHSTPIPSTPGVYISVFQSVMTSHLPTRSTLLLLRHSRSFC